MKRLNLNFSIILIIFLYSSCVIDWKSDLVVIKNSSPNSILIAYQPTATMTDSILYNERFDEIWIDANKFQIISLPNIKFSTKPDSVKCYIYIFNGNVVDNYQKIKKMKGIKADAFIQKTEIQLNEVKEPLDTIIIK